MLQRPVSATTYLDGHTANSVFGLLSSPCNINTRFNRTHPEAPEKGKLLLQSSKQLLPFLIIKIQVSWKMEHRRGPRRLLSMQTLRSRQFPGLQPVGGTLPVRCLHPTIPRGQSPRLPQLLSLPTAVRRHHTCERLYAHQGPRLCPPGAPAPPPAFSSQRPFKFPLLYSSVQCLVDMLLF